MDWPSLKICEKRPPQPLEAQARMFGSLDRRTHPRSYLAGTATIFLENRKAGDYLVQNVSAGGVLLTGGPSIPEGDAVGVLLRLSGVRDLRVSGVVLRRQGQDDAGCGFAVRFLRISLAAQDLIQQAVLASLVRSNEPSVLVVDPSIKSITNTMRALDALKRRPILARRPLDVIRWLSDPDTVVQAAVVERSVGSDDGPEVVRFIAREFPSVRRVLVAGLLHRDELHQYHADGAVDAILLRPWRARALAIALAQARSQRPAPPAPVHQRVGTSATLLPSDAAGPR